MYSKVIPLTIVVIASIVIPCSSCSSSGGNDADLSSLTISEGTLSPAFDKDTLSYSAKVSLSTVSVTFKPTAEQGTNSLITINDLPSISGIDSAPVLIYPGANTATIIVKSPDRSTTRTYTVTVNSVINDLESILQGNDTGNSDSFGWSIACDGTTLVIGAPHASGGGGPGAVYIFKRGTSSWVQEQKLTGGAPGDLFGWSVSLSGSTIAVGAPHQSDGVHTENGAAYMFVESGGVWAQQGGILFSFSPSPSYYFGSSVSLQGNTLAVGEPNGGSGYHGDVQIFTRSGVSWANQAVLVATPSVANSYFGQAISLDSGTLAIGAQGDDSTVVGAVYIFTGSGSSWTQQQEISPPTTSLPSSFGSAVSLSGSRLIIGSETESTTQANSGAVYLFAGSGSSWTQAGIALKSTSPLIDEHFGHSVSIVGNIFAVGASGPLLPTFQRGSACVFGKGQFFTWSQVEDPLIPSGTASSLARFGQSIVVTDTEIIVGADFYNGDGSGAVYVYH
jgi:hypothetical protein